MLPAERLEAIKDIIAERRSETVIQLAQELDVSTETIRRDLNQLEQEGYLTKTHGGAIIRSRVMLTASPKARSTMYVESKKAIAKEAARFVLPGDCIFLDWSTTVYEICPLIASIPLTIVTPSLPILNYFADSDNINIICPGGQYNKDSGTFRGIDTLSFLKSHSFDKSFISCRSVNLDCGLCTQTQFSAEILYQVITRSAATYLLADHTKLNKSSYAHICPIDKISTIIVDTPLSPVWTAALAENKVQYIISEKG